MATDTYAIPQTILRHFDLASNIYTDAGAAEVSARRRLYPNGRLFFDQLLSLAQLDGPALYPPTSPAGLRRLLHAIHSSQQDRLKQDCYLYYLLRDFDASRTRQQVNVSHANGSTQTYEGSYDDAVDDSETGRSEGFAKRRCIPRTWRVFMDGYWALDHAEWELAVKCLSDASVSELDFVPQIINTFASQVSPPSRAMSILRSFFLSASVQLPSPLERDTKVLSLAGAGSLLEAFKYIRDHSMEEQARMRERLWSWALGASAIPCGAGQHGVHPRVLKEMLHLPLGEDEHSHLVHFLSHPPRTISPSALSALHDLVTLRLVHQGQYAESLQLDKASAGLAGADSDRQRRREMVREFTAILPGVQRRALAIDSDERAKNMDVPMTNGHSAEVEDFAMDNSWIALHSPARADTHNGDTSITALKASNSIYTVASASGSPAPARSPLPRSASPFTGPPRFASHSRLGSPAPVNRILSGSPFALPSSRVVSRHGSPALGPRRIIDDDDAPMDSPRPRNLSVGSMPRQSLRDMVLRPQSRPESPRPSEVVEIEDHIAEDPPEELLSDPEPQAEPELEGQRESSPEVPVEQPKQSRSSRRKPKPATKIRSPTPEHEPPPAREATPPVASPPPSPPSHRTRSHDTPSSPHSVDEAVPRSSRKRRGRTSMPGAFDPHEEPIPEDQVLPPTPAPITRRTGSRTQVQTEAEPPRTRITRSSSRALLDEDDQAQGPPKRARRNAREGSAASQISTISETPGASLVRRSTRTRRGEAATEGRSGARGRSRTGATPTSERASPTPSNATSVNRGQLVPGARRSTRRDASVDNEKGTSTRRTTRRR